ncbi:hypothetical protein NLJ89_g1840 [Agrocybe chaxingu]|uniref:Major facilitator superfamily (MFS) profile domain-containing protein n=1 Tax=Agrocybe chaxingu TaxID=84603 RepID=A0A9W8TEI9_9AGAR|nr:hypothetical protein NLJ89_g1840 [Agrocybe chaxingu]
MAANRREHSLERLISNDEGDDTTSSSCGDSDTTDSAIFSPTLSPSSNFTATVIYPFVNDLIRSLGVTGGDEKRTGYYVGIVCNSCPKESVFYATEALTVMHWGSASDSIGRRPILLGGVAGLALAMVGFGMSRQYWMLIFSRCMQGVFNGNIGVMKSVMGEITDSTNAAQAFSFLPIAWSIGSTVGPFIGGAFADPAERWPRLFGKIQFFQTYPYFLPCFVAALVPICAFFFAFLGLKETLPPTEITPCSPNQKTDFDRESCRAPLIQHPSSSPADTNYGTLTRPTSIQDPPLSPSPTCGPSSKPSFRDVLIPQVLIPVSNFAFLAFLDQSFLVLVPLIYSTPLEHGGLDLPPSTIGSILGGWGVLNGFVQVFLFPRLRKWVGHRNLYVSGIIALGIGLGMFPLLNWLAKMEGDGDGTLGVFVWCGIAVQLGVYMLTYMSYACMFMYISASAPSRFLLGTTNGLAQLTASSVRAAAPTTASSLFSLSLELRTLGGLSGFLGGYLVYAVFVSIPAVAALWGFTLPSEI